MTYIRCNIMRNNKYTHILGAELLFETTSENVLSPLRY